MKLKLYWVQPILFQCTLYTLGKNLGSLMRLEGGLVFVQSVLTKLKYYLFWVLRVGNRVGEVILL